MQKKIPHFHVFRVNRRNFSVYLSDRVLNLISQPIRVNPHEPSGGNQHHFRQVEIVHFLSSCHIVENIFQLPRRYVFSLFSLYFNNTNPNISFSVKKLNILLPSLPSQVWGLTPQSELFFSGL
jgi:hypothetical protein